MQSFQKCSDPRCPRGCQGSKSRDPQFEDGGPGCGVAEHAPSCLCDVKL